MSVPGAPEEAKVVATLDGKHISGEIQIDTGGMGYPTIEADIVEEDHIVGVISFQGMDVDLDANRIDKASVVFKVVKRKSRGKDGRPLPPEVDESLEPLRAVIDQKIPLLVAARSAAQIDVALKTAEAFEISVVILGGDQAQAHAEVLAEKSFGVVLPTRIVRKKHNRWYHQADDLTRRGVPIGFQSDAEDGVHEASPLMGVSSPPSFDQRIRAIVWESPKPPARMWTK